MSGPAPSSPALAQPRYRVLVNDEGQYSAWPAALAIPDGWRADGPAGSREECLLRIEALWTDMRPASLR